MNTSLQLTALHFRSSRGNRPVIIVIACFLLVSQVVYAQTVSGVVGTVTDPSGTVVPGAHVTVTNNATGVLSHAVTSSVGTYTITDLIPGAYTVKIQKPGFETWVLANLIVDPGGKKSTADAALRIGATTQSVEVQSSAITLDTEQP